MKKYFNLTYREEQVVRRGSVCVDPEKSFETF
jgi:hypothetical protein